MLRRSARTATTALPPIPSTMQLVTVLLALPMATVAFAPTARPLRPHNAATIVRSSPATGAGDARKPRPKYVPGRIDDPDYVRGQ